MDAVVWKLRHLWDGIGSAEPLRVMWGVSWELLLGLVLSRTQPWAGLAVAVNFRVKYSVIF